MQTKFKYPAETTANAAKIPRQMSLFFKQDQITSNLRNDSETTTTLGKHHTPIPRKRNSRQIQNNQIKIIVISRLNNKTASAQNIEKLYKNANLTKF